jgi:hypothetical protein
MSRIDSSGDAYFGLINSSYQVLINSGGAGILPLRVRGAASQSANLFEAQNSAGGTVTSVSNIGTLNVNTAGTGIINIGDAQISKAPGSGFAFTSGLGQITSIGIQTAATNSEPMKVVLIDPTYKTIIRGAASQSANLIELQNSSSAVLGGRNALGQAFTGSGSAILANTQISTATSGNGTTATITTTTAHSYVVGDTIVVSGITPSGYNGRYTITAVASTTVSYLNATTGSQIVPGLLGVEAQQSVTARSAGTKGLIIRGATSQSANLFELQDTAGATLASINSAAVSTFTRAFAINQTNAGEAIFVTRGASSQTGDQIAVRDSSANTVGGFSATGRLYSGVSGSGQSYLGGLTLGSGSVISQLGVIAAAATTVGAVIRGATSQTADLLQLQNSAGTTMGRFDAYGYFSAFGYTLPSSGGSLENAYGGSFLGLKKTTSAVANPGASGGRLYFVDGTVPGTLKLVVRAGAAGAETTILDNIPQ